MTEIILACVIVVVSACGVLLAWRFLSAMQSQAGAHNSLSTRCIEELQANHVAIMHKMEVWHESELRATRSHVERILESTMASVEDQAHALRAHVEERAKEHETASIHSTNERRADLQERVTAKTPIPSDGKVSQRKPIERSGASLARQAIEEGRVPQRH